MLRLVLIFGILLNLHVFAQEKPEQAAEKPAVDWLDLVDAGQYGESWDSAAETFKSAITKEKWIESLTSVRNQTGKLKSRKLKSARYTENPSNAPAGKYVVIQYDSVFDIGAAVETVVPTQEKDGSWKVSGYFVKPAQ